MYNAEKPRRQLIYDAVMTAAGSDVQIVVRNALFLWEQVARHFEPLIGTASVCLIFARSIELNKPVFPWLHLVLSPGIGRASFADHGTDLLGQSAADAIGAACAVLGTFFELLDALIGARLTDLFLHLALAGVAQDNATRGPQP